MALSPERPQGRVASRTSLLSVYPDRRRRRQFVERPYAANAVPRVLRSAVRVRLRRARRSRGTKNSFVNVVSSTRPVWPYVDDLVVILEVDHLERPPVVAGHNR